jgi:hypothetical protein
MSNLADVREESGGTTPLITACQRACALLKRIPSNDTVTLRDGIEQGRPRREFRYRQRYRHSRLVLPRSKTDLLGQ